MIARMCIHKTPLAYNYSMEKQNTRENLSQELHHCCAIAVFYWCIISVQCLQTYQQYYE